METLTKNAGGAGTEEKEVSKYMTIKDGFGYDITVANLNHPSWAAFKGIVKVEAIKINKHGNKRFIIKNARERISGSMIGISLGPDRLTKEIRWESIELHEIEFFDLSIPKERQRFIVVSNHHTFEGSPNQFGRAHYRVIDQEKKALNYLNERKDKKRAQEIVENMDYDQLIDIAVPLGITPKAHSQSMLTAEIYRIADTDHKKFLTIWDNPDRKGVITFQNALNYGLINFDAINGYTYSNIQLGKTEPAAHKFMTTNMGLMSTLDELIKERRVHEATGKQMPSTGKITEKTVSDAEAELAELKKQLAELKAKQSSSIAPVLNTDEDLEALQKEAKELGMQGAHLYKDQAKLKEKIDEIKNK